MPLRAMLSVAVIDVLLFVTLWGGLRELGDPWPGTLLAANRQIYTALLAVWVMAKIAPGARPGAVPDYPPMHDVRIRR
jgi:hypothetical protein